ncbi:MAG TPA: spore germination protein [Firmicutes bacterium]|jgi:stage V sporulation protein AF|nr:spore germination protein [Bacillota bacterium]
MPAEDEKKTYIYPKLDQNIEYLRRELGIDLCFDILLREFMIGQKRALFLFLDGFANSSEIIHIMKSLFVAKREEIVPHTMQKIVTLFLPYGEVSTVDNLEEAVQQFLSGPLIFFMDGEKEALIIDIRQYPARGPEEPDIEKITRGSRDGFVETLLFNATLIRRRVRDPKLRTEIFKIGKRSLSEVALVYIEDIANPHILEIIKDRFAAIDIDGLPMAEKSVEEFITNTRWNPFPNVRYTERPDVAAAHLFEGHICIIVDTSPSVIIAPVTLFHHIQHAEEFRHNAIVGAYIRLVRLLGVFLSVFLIPLWLLLAEHQSMLPDFLKFIGPKEAAHVPLFVQFIMANIGLDLIRLASIHTPSPLATALGLVGALLIGDIAVKVGFFAPEILLYISIVAIGVFSTPSWELGLANRLTNLFLLILTGLFKLPGFLAGLLILLIYLGRTRSFGVPYLYPLIPFNWHSLMDVLFRKPLPLRDMRPSFLQPKDADIKEIEDQGNK